MRRLRPLKEEVQHKRAVRGGAVQEPIVPAIPRASDHVATRAVTHRDAIHALLPVPLGRVVGGGALAPVRRHPPPRVLVAPEDLVSGGVVVPVGREGDVGGHGSVLGAVQIDHGHPNRGCHRKALVERPKLWRDRREPRGQIHPQLVRHHAAIGLARGILARRVHAQLRLKRVVQRGDESAHVAEPRARRRRPCFLACRPVALRVVVAAPVAARVAVFRVVGLLRAGVAAGAGGLGRAHSIPRIPRAAPV